MTTSWNGNVGKCDRNRNFGGLNLFGLNWSKFGALAEATNDEIPHVEQHDTSERTCKKSHTIGDAIDASIRVNQHEFQVEGDVHEQEQEKHKKRTGDEGGQKTEGKEAVRVEPRTLEKQGNIHARRSICPQDQERSRPIC